MKKKLIVGGLIVCAAAVGTAYGIKKYKEHKNEAQCSKVERKKIVNYLKLLEEKRERDNEKIKELLSGIRNSLNKKAHYLTVKD